MRIMGMGLLLLLLLPLAAVTGCSSSKGFCEAAADCDQEFFGIPADGVGDSDDDVAVCTAGIDAEQAALRANEEDECSEVAAKREEFLACVANEFYGGEDGCDAIEECDDEFADFQEAQSDVNGDECRSTES